MTRQVVVDIVGDSTKFNSATQQAIGQSTKLGGAFSTLKSGAATGLGLVGVIGVASLAANAIGTVTDTIGNSIKAASDLAETQSKVGVVFGKSGAEVLKWGQTTSTAMGISSNKALAAAAQYGNLFVSLGLTGGKAADMSTKMVTLAGDMASFNNASIEDTLLAIQSGLVGETEPLRKFGVNLNDAALRQQALDMGLVKSTKETLPAAVKAQAAYALILEQSKTAQGDFARTSDGLANQQRIAAAKMEDSLARLGATITPLAQTLVPMLANAAIGLVDGFMGVIKAAQPLIAQLQTQFGPTVALVGKFITGTLLPAVGQLAGQLASQLGPVIKTVATFIATTLAPAIMTVARTAIPIIVQAIKTAVDILGFLWRAIQPVVSALLSVLVPAFKAVVGFITGTVVPVISNVARTVFPILQTAARVLGPIVIQVFANIGAAVRLAGSIIGTAITIAGNVIRTVFTTIGTVVRTAQSVISTVANAIGTIFRGIGTAATNLYNGIRTAVGNIISAIGSMPGRIASAVRGLWDGLWNGFRNVVNSIIRGWNSIRFSIPSVNLGPLGTFGGFSIGTPNLPYLHTGGRVPGTPGSNVMAVLQAGEHVLERTASPGADVTVVINGNVYGGPAGLDELASDIAWRLRLQGVTR